jgi:hypothetical protein
MFTSWSSTRWTLLSWLAAMIWVAVLSAILTTPHAIASSSLGDDLTRWTVRLSLAYYAMAAGLMLLLRGEEWRARGLGRLARTCWTLAWTAYLVHVAVAFHYYHHWSHSDAVEHTREVSGVGEGIYVSHLFTLVWGADVVTWWISPNWYATRTSWLGKVLHLFMTFIIFNATVVYETGPIRWAGICMYVALLGLLLNRRRFPPIEHARSKPPIRAWPSPH